MRGKAARIRVTERQHGILRQIVHSTTASHRLIQRAHVILLAFRGQLNEAIASEIGLGRKQVGQDSVGRSLSTRW